MTIRQLKHRASIKVKWKANYRKGLRKIGDAFVEMFKSQSQRGGVFRRHILGT